MKRPPTAGRPQRRMRRAARRVLTDRLGPRPARMALSESDARYPAIAARIPRTRAGARDLLRTSAYVIALYDTLVAQGIDSATAEDLIAEAVYASIMPARATLYRLGGLRHRSPLRRARWGARLSRRLYYTSPDWKVTDVEVDPGFGFDVTRCVVAEFFESFGMERLCDATICDQDVRSAAHHGLVFERSETLAAGGSRCDFRYRSAAERPAGQASRSPESVPSGRHAAPPELAADVEIDAPPERVWAWLTTMADHYTDWHPDHVSARWILGSPNQVGSRLEAVELFAGHRERLVFEMTAIDPQRSMEYRIVGPHSILLPGGRFLVSAQGHGSVFTAQVDVRFRRLARIAFGRRLASLRSHMHEEGQALKRLIEAELEPTPRHPS